MRRSLLSWVACGLICFCVHVAAYLLEHRHVESSLKLPMTSWSSLVANADLEGCTYDAGSYGCVTTPNGVNNGHCDAQLSLTVTQGAYYDQPDTPSNTPQTGNTGGESDNGGSVDQGSSDGDPELVVGSAERIDSVVISRAELEAHAAAAALGSDSDRHPTLEQLLVSGTPEAALLATMFTKDQEPYSVVPLGFTPITAEELAVAEVEPPALAGGGHRRRQLQSDSYGGLRISVKTMAATTRGAKDAFTEFLAAVGGHVDNNPPDELGSENGGGASTGSGRRAMTIVTEGQDAGQALTAREAALERLLEQRDREITALKAALSNALQLVTAAQQL